VILMAEEKAYLKKYVEGFVDALNDAGLALQKHEHKERTIKEYGTEYQEKSNNVNIRQDDHKGYDEGMKDAYATVGQDLQDFELKDYSVEDYGQLYQNIARQIGDCVHCKDIGTEKGCPAGQTIWCPRILEILKE